MSDNYTPKNYGLFEKYIGKISKAIISKLGSKENIITFLNELCKTGHVGLAAKKTLSNLISPLLLYKIINSDRNLSKCVRLAKNYAEEIAIVKAEAILYESAINGYEELTYNENGKCIVRKKKYCSKSLLEYLKANSPKYQTNSKSVNINEIRKLDNTQIVSSDIDVFEIEPYELEGSSEDEETSSY